MLRFTVVFVVLLICIDTCYAQFDTIINLPPTVFGDNATIGSNTQVNVLEGGTIGHQFSAGTSGVISEDLEINVLGGSVGVDFDALAGSRVNISGGTVGDGIFAEQSQIMVSAGTIGDDFKVRNGSEIMVSGGTIGDHFSVRHGSQATISGGTVGANSFFRDNSTITISGGEIGGSLRAVGGGEVVVTGGNVGDGFIAWQDGRLIVSGGQLGDRYFLHSGAQALISGGTLGQSFEASEGSSVTISGNEFRFGGTRIAEFLNAGESLPINVADGVLFSGILSDGTPFAFSRLDWDTSDGDLFADGSLTIEASELPPLGPPAIVASNGDVPLGLRPGQTLVVDDGGVVNDNFVAGPGSSILVSEGGIVGKNLEVVDGEVVISGGTRAVRQQSLSPVVRSGTQRTYIKHEPVLPTAKLATTSSFPL